MLDDFVYNNEDMLNESFEDNFMNNLAEEEFGQLHAIHLHMNAVADVRKQLAEQAARPSLCHCESCGEEIPQARRQLIPGVRLCVYCKEREEHK
jgi:phage/conjugal plasmid C-4 type zinc finger TraR family protein